MLTRIIDGNLQESLYNEIAKERIGGKRVLRLFGRNADVDNVRETVWPVGGEYVFPLLATQMAIVSTSANDTSNGTGVRVVELHYLDSDYVEHDEIITLNGLTLVNTVATNILRVYKLHVLTVGSNGVAVGDIALKNLAGTITYAQIPATFNISFDCIFTVPLGYTYYVTSWKISCGNSNGNRYGEFYLRATCHDDEGIIEYIPGIFHVWDTIGVQDGAFKTVYNLPLRFVEKTDIIVDVVSDSGTANAICLSTIGGYLEKN